MITVQYLTYITTPSTNNTVLKSTYNKLHNHKNYNFLDCDCFKKLLFFHFTCHVVIGQFVFGQFNEPITFKVVIACVRAVAFVFLAPNCWWEVQ